MRIKRLLGLGMLAACSLGWAQPQAIPSVPPPKPFGVEQPDAQRTREEMGVLLDRYPPSLRIVLSVDPSLLGNQSFLTPYPALVSFLTAHPEIEHNPSFYVNWGAPPFRGGSPAVEMSREVLSGVAAFLAFGMGISLLVWLIRTLVDYRRWNRLSRIQTEFHSKLMDRFTANNELLAYMQSPAGTKFLESSPITLDAAPRSMGAPFGRILWSVQGGVVLVAAGIGLWVVSRQVADEASQPLHALGVIGIALGLGFAASAIISFVISRRLGLIESRPSGTQE